MARSFEVVRMPYMEKAQVDEATIAKWETRRGVRLPEDYRHFILATNGGALRPYTFELTDPRIPMPDIVWLLNSAPPGRQLHAVTCLNDWSGVLEASQEHVPPYLRNTPPEHLAIGSTEDDALFIMLSLAHDNFGAVVVWPKDLFEPWGEGSNTFVIPLAQSFADFLDLLQDYGKDAVYHGYWASHDKRHGTADFYYRLLRDDR